MHSPPQISVDKVVEGRNTIISAYEFALQTIGMDKESGLIWLDYIQFIKSGETTNTFEEQQKMDQLRKLYTRAVKTPLTLVEQVWKDYEEGKYDEWLKKLGDNKVNSNNV